MQKNQRMDLTLEKENTAIGSIFQQIITDLKNTSPLWEDFVSKAVKLHTCLRATIQAISSYLDAFQKIADAATNSRGASKEIGTALTRVCLRHKAVETRMKTFTTAVMDCLITPLQDKLEEWKRQVVCLDKDHAKEYKRCRSELKKRSSDTLRLQKKARKGQSDTIQSLVDSYMNDVTIRRAELEEVERKSLRAAMIEERMRYCSFVNMLQLVVKEECEVMFELGHLQEAMQSIAIVTKEPNILPQSSEELILESKSSLSLYPESPGGNSGSNACSNSLGSRKNSVCSISSMNSSGSSSSPGHHTYQSSLSQLMTPMLLLKPGESSDSGFCSSPALISQASTNVSQSHAISTWPPHSQDVPTTDRPHTISSAYEKGHQRPALTVYTFQNPEPIIETEKSLASTVCRPPLPIRCSSLERPMSSLGSRNNTSLMQRQCPSPIPVHIAKELPQQLPTYVNTFELASMVLSRNADQQQEHLLRGKSYKDNNKTNYNQSITSPKNSSDLTSEAYDEQDRKGNAYGWSVADSSRAISEAKSDCEESSPYKKQLANNSNVPLKNKIESFYAAEGGGSGGSSNPFIGTEIKDEQKSDDANSVSSSTAKDSDSPDKDVKSLGSVLEKTFLFEKLEKKQTLGNNNIQGSNNFRSNTGHTSSAIADMNVESHKEEVHKGSEGVEDSIYENCIQELNDVIDKLDSFQREHESKQQVSNPLQHQGNFTNAFQIEDDSRNVSTVAIPTYAPNANIGLIQPDPETVILRRKYLPTGRSFSEKLPSEKQFSSFRNERQQSYVESADTSNTHRIRASNSNEALNTNLVFPRRSIGRNEEHAKLSIPPKPASLSGCMSRTTRRPSVKVNKPPPPVRRSSSVTPNNNFGTLTTKTLAQQTAMNASAESLPPPPAYLLDRTATASPTINVAETVKALTVIRHTPASPSVSRRSPNLPPQVTASQQPFRALNATTPAGIYAQPRQVTKMSSFRSASPGTNKANPGLFAQLNARLNPNKKAASQEPQHTRSSFSPESINYHHNPQQENIQGVHVSEQKSPYHQSYIQPEQIYAFSGDRYYYGQQHLPQGQSQQLKYDDPSPLTNERSGSIRSKTKAEFLENLNAKLAKQGLSGKAFAVRNLINSKALPDPRLCHESLMDQIKRGATLKRNKTINDRSAPKIY